MSLSREEIEKRIYPQKIEDRAAQKEIADVRAILATAMEIINDSVPPSREQSLSLTKLEEACHWAVKGIARGQEVKEPNIDLELNGHKYVQFTSNTVICKCGRMIDDPIHI